MAHRLALVVLVGSLVACGDNVHIGGGTLLVTPQTSLYTDEAGAAARFTVRLTAVPQAEVLVDVSSSNVDEGTVYPSTLIFDAGSYNVPQTVTVTGIDDARVDGDRAFVVRLDAAEVGALELDVTNGDDDMAGVLVTPLVGLMTTEAGAQAAFTVRLTSQPAADVRVPVSSSDATEGATTVTELAFTADNWSTPQTVQVTGAQDTLVDGTVTYSIVLGHAASTDMHYDGIDPDDVQLVNIDDDLRGIAVTPGAGLATAESGTSDAITVVLQTAPSANVTIPVSSSDASEVSVSTSQLVFTPQNWNTPQTVTLTGVDDATDDDDQSFTIVLGGASSSDADYDGVDVDDVTGTNADDDTAAITVTPTAGLVTTESGGADAFTVQLASQPTANVTIAVTTSDATEGAPVQTSLTFTVATWSTPQTVTVDGVNDSLTDGDQSYSIILGAAVSTDAKYSGMDPADVAVTNTDNDVPGVTIEPLQLEVSEFQDADVATIVLNTAPTSNVTINLASTDTTEGTVLPSTIVFTPLTWNIPQAINVTGQNDAIADGNITFSITTSAAISADAGYANLDPPDISVINIDNDTAQVYVKARRRLNVSENGQSTTYRMRLTVAPTAPVTCTLQSSDLTEGTASPTTLTFQPNNFGYQTVTVTGVNDNIDDGDVFFTIVNNACTSADLAYQGSNPQDLGVVNRDND